MSNISGAGMAAGLGVDNQSFEVTGLKRTTILTGNHHVKPKQPDVIRARARTMSEHD